MYQEVYFACLKNSILLATLTLCTISSPILIRNLETREVKEVVQVHIKLFNIVIMEVWVD